MDRKSDKVIIEASVSAGKKVESSKMAQIYASTASTAGGQPQQPQFKFLPKLQSSSSKTSSNPQIVQVATQVGSTNPQRPLIGNLVNAKQLPTMLKRLPGNISVSAQSIIIQPDVSASATISTATPSINLIPNQPVIVQPINMDLTRSKLQETPQSSLLKQIQSRTDNKVVVERIGERPKPIVTQASLVTNPAPKIQVLNSTIAMPSRRSDETYIVNAMPNESKSVIVQPQPVFKIRPASSSSSSSDKVKISLESSKPKIQILGQTIYKPIAPAPTPVAILPKPAVTKMHTTATIKTTPTISKLPVQPMAGASNISITASGGAKDGDKMDKIFIVRNTRTGSTELVRGKIFV